MKPLIMIALLVSCPMIGWCQSRIDLALADDQHQYPRLLSPVFDSSSEYLISILGNKIRVFATADGSLLREFVLPIRELRNQDFTNLSSYYQRGQISLTLSGTALLVIADRHFVDANATPEPIFLIDVDQLVHGENVTPVQIHYPLKSKYQPRRFVCSLGADRLVFVTRDSTHNAQLLLYQLAENRFNPRSAVELRSIACRTPEYLCCSYYLSPLTYLSGPTADESGVNALQVTPDPPNRTAWAQPPSCKVEQLKITWDDRGYGSLKTIDAFSLPTLPVVVPANIGQYLAISHGGLPSGGILQNVYLATLGSPNRPLKVGAMVGQQNRSQGRTGLWSGDSSRFFLNDGNSSRQLRPRVISVHDSSGRRIGLLPIGKGIQASVLATSHDGRFAVTRNDLDLRPRSKRQNIGRIKPSEFTLWNLQ